MLVVPVGGSATAAPQRQPSSRALYSSAAWVRAAAVPQEGRDFHQSGEDLQSVLLQYYRLPWLSVRG